MTFNKLVIFNILFVFVFVLTIFNFYCIFYLAISPAPPIIFIVCRQGITKTVFIIIIITTFSMFMFNFINGCWFLLLLLSRSNQHVPVQLQQSVMFYCCVLHWTESSADFSFVACCCLCPLAAFS